MDIEIITLHSIYNEAIHPQRPQQIGYDQSAQ